MSSLNGSASMRADVVGIVLAAGAGTRMKSERPKVLHRVCGRPMLWFALRALADAGISDAVVVTSPANDAAIREADIAPEGVHVRYAVQEHQLGTGDAVRAGLATIPNGERTIVVTNGDMPLIEGALLREVLAACDSLTALALVTARMPLPSSFGRIVRDGETVERIVEARDCTPDELAIDEMNAGVYAFDEAALRDALGRLTTDNAQGEYYLTDTVAIVVGDGSRVVPIVADDYRTVLGVNDRVELAAASAVMNARELERHMRAGVTIVDPATTWIEDGVTIGIDAVIWPNTRIGAGSSIGERSEIGPNTRIERSAVAADVRVMESVVIDSRIGAHTSVGPFAHLRGGAMLGEHVRVGNFVEVKNSRFAEGAKASHLSYVGDATVGEQANIGAGTITCNYDGKTKHPTTIGARASIGSNSSLIAPIEIGEDALTGAGSVVTRDVPAGGRVAGNPARPLPSKATS